MNKYWYSIITIVAGLTGFAFLVVHDHQWMALLCLLAIATIRSKDE